MTETFEPRLLCQTPNIVDSEAFSCTTSVVESTHRENLHDGPEHVRGMLNKGYWIIELGNVLRKIRSTCVKC